MSEVTFADRKTGELIKENPPGASFLKFMYGNNPLGKLSLHLLIKRKIVSAIGGWYMNTKRSAKKIDPFVEKHQMELSDYVVPDDGFSTFNDFFYRKIKPESRPIENGLVSPADGKILVFDNVDDNKEFFVKGAAFNLSSFLNDAELAKKYAGGGMAIIRLAPVDYHRFHFSAKGIISKSKLIDGHYYSVSPIALKQSLEIFCHNKREYSVLKTNDYGDVLFCEVGATMVGGIIQTYIDCFEYFTGPLNVWMRMALIV